MHLNVPRRDPLGYIVFAWMLVAAPSASSGAVTAPTADDYARAERFLPWNTTRLILHAAGQPTWLPDGRFYYRRGIRGGTEFVLVDPKRGIQSPPFDPSRLAAALSAEMATMIDPLALPFKTFRMLDNKTITFVVDSRHWTCSLLRYTCSGTEEHSSVKDTEVLSPDGKWVAFIRDYNLWIREQTTHTEYPLTLDGVKDFGYATDNAGWRRSDRAILSWSPDSKRIASYQQDEREVGDMYLAGAQVGHPKLDSWKISMPGDAVTPTVQRVVINVPDRRVVRFRMAPDQRRMAHCEDLGCAGQLTDVEWSPDGQRLAFVSMSRDYKIVTLRLADSATGEVRDILQEQVPTYYESATSWTQKARNWRYLWNTNEVVWFSERSNWGHLYLYDAITGKLEREITTGDWNVIAILRIDDSQRRVYALGVGREAGRDPYFMHLYDISLDSNRVTLLTPENANHIVSMPASGDSFVDRYSRPDVPPTAVVRNNHGKLMRVLERADITQLTASGWQPPVSVTVKARDGVTDLYGLMFKPTHFDVTRQYPIVNCIYPGPQIGSVGVRMFGGPLSTFADAQSLAELGFVVVAIDAMGTPWRSKTFHDAHYGDLADNGLPDQIAAMKQLAQQYPWIDIDRAGIYGISGGGYAAARAILKYPEFFKVSVSQSGNHDNRGIDGEWGEKYNGLLVERPDGSSNYDGQENQTLAKNLKGHLLLVAGTSDDVVPPYETLTLVDALIASNKDFDSLMLPNQSHVPVGVPGMYVMRWRWDYFVRHLLGAEPPSGIQLRVPGRGMPLSYEEPFAP